MILYTRTVCPKCMFVKTMAEGEGKLDAFEVINMDEHPHIKDQMRDMGIAAAPVLLKDDKYYTDVNEIIRVIAGDSESWA